LLLSAEHKQGLKMGRIHPAKGMTRPQKRDFELIATGKRPLGGHLTIEKLKARGLIKDGPPVVVGHNSFGPVVLPSWVLPHYVRVQWELWLAEQWPGSRKPGQLTPRKDEFSEEHGCKSKVRYATEPAGNEKVEPYKCRFCDGWHLTSKAQPMDKPALPKRPFRARHQDYAEIKSNALDRIGTSHPVDSAAKRVGGRPWRSDRIRRS
jgi:hypothetical protein